MKCLFRYLVLSPLRVVLQCFHFPYKLYETKIIIITFSKVVYLFATMCSSGVDRPVLARV